MLGEGVHRFGQVNQGEVIGHTYRFVNEGKAYLQVEDVQADCGCTVPKWPHKPIAPGDTAQIDVRFSTKGKMGPQRKALHILTNEPEGKRMHRLYLEGEVIMPVVPPPPSNFD